MQFSEIIRESLQVHEELIHDDGIRKQLEKLIEAAVHCYQNQGKILFCGNGGSAADAQHLAAELSGRFAFDRPPLFAEALHTNTSYLTAVANDYSYDEIFARLVKAMGKPGDILIALSTSGNSRNVINAIHEANRIGMITAGFTGKSGGKMKELCHFIFRVPSENTPRIQECHILLGHIFCGAVEKALFPQ